MKLRAPAKITPAVMEMMALPVWVVDPTGEFVGGYATKAQADAECKEMNCCARQDYWRVVDKPELVLL